MKLTVFLSLFFALNTFFSPFLSGARAPVGLNAREKARSKPIKLSPVSSPNAMITGQSAGPTPFIAQINATVTPSNSLQSVQFSITPKSGSVTRPVSATYTANYLKSRNYLNTGTGSDSVIVPVFGLYESFANTVVLTFFFTDGSSQQTSVPVSTALWSDTCGVYKSPLVLQMRTTGTALSYDYILIKNPTCGSQSPVIIDTDGAVRWVGPTGFGAFSSMPFANGIYIGSFPPSSSKRTGISRIEFDGILSFVHDYSNIDVTNTSHHNYDPGKQGMLVEVDTTTQTESVILEVDTSGNVLNTWNFANIISAAISSSNPPGDPTQFVKPAPTDWFHNNAATYKKSDNTLIVSSRENFVIAVDYDTKAIKWILGDPTKKWHNFQGLSAYALTVDPNSLPPIGQHAVSITHDDNLLLFDDGLFSLNNSPKGEDRNYSAPRKYHIDTQTMPMTATEIWNYPHGQTLYSPICSSIYEDDPLNYLVDYSNEITPNIGAPFAPSNNEILGLDNAGNLVFDYRYANSSGCGTGWNSIPIHLERMTFTSVVPLRAVSRKTHGNGAGTYDIDLPLSGKPGIECRTGDDHVVVTFATTPVSVISASVTSDSGGTASAGTPAISGKDVTVDLTGVSNAQTLTVKLVGVSDGTNTDDVSVRVSILQGDTTGNGKVNSSDISQTQSQSGQPVTGANFREDVDGNGHINSTDILSVQSMSGTALP